MIKMRPYAPPDRIAIRDSIDEEISDDIEDDVFIRDGKSAKHDEEKGLKRPLMAPRRKNSKSGDTIPIMKKRRRCWKCCEPFCYGLAALTILILLILLAAFILTLFPIPLQKIKIWLKRDQPLSIQLEKYETREVEFVPCTQISVQRIWSRTFARLNSECPVRKSDLNGDGVLDVIFGYGIDESIQYEEISFPKCITARQDDKVPCEGGVIALNGKNGDLLWQQWSSGNVFSLLCTMDIDMDSYPDCIAAGSRGLIFAINGRNGNVFWNFHELDVETNSPIVNDFYTINSVRDLDGDEIPDILAIHVEERKTSRAGHIKLISGKSGKVIRSIPTPFQEVVFVPLQVITKQDGTEVLLIITGGQNTSGGVYSIRLLSIMKYTSKKQFTPLFQTKYSGFMVPAVLADVNEDMVDDIIVASFNSTVFAFDGRNYSMLWNYSFPSSESVSSIVPGHFNHDNITDFMIKYNSGPGFPVYYYSQTTILNGANGQPLLDSMMMDSGGPNGFLGGVSVSQTFGGDFFLHWQVQCRGKYNMKDPYDFVPDSEVNQQARADTCLLRYNTSTVLKLYAIARHVEPPGAVIFSSDDLNIHLNQTSNRRLIQQNAVSPLKHPKMLKKFNTNDYIAGNSQPILPIIRNDEKKYEDRELHRKPAKVLQFPEPERERVLYDPAKPYFYGLPNNQLGQEFKDYDTDQRNPDEYDILYGDDQQNERPIRMKSKYPGNRGVRSDVSDYDTIHSNDTTTTGTPDENTHNEDEQPLNLWDLEMEKEEQEARKEAHKYDYTVRQRRSTEEGDGFLAAVSSTGVLLPSLDNSSSAIDFVFVLNIRESESYPPLFLPQDLSCVEDKLSAYKSYSNDERVSLEKKIVKKCLESRMEDITPPPPPKYESQIVVTRISITCTCGPLQEGETCSKLEGYEQQKWTEYMGNSGSGFYRN